MQPQSLADMMLRGIFGCGLKLGYHDRNTYSPYYSCALFIKIVLVK